MTLGIFLQADMKTAWGGNGKENIMRIYCLPLASGIAVPEILKPFGQNILHLIMTKKRA